MATGSSVSGLLADGLIARGVPTLTVRKALQAVAFLIPAVALLLLAQPGLQPQVRVTTACPNCTLQTTHCAEPWSRY